MRRELARLASQHTPIRIGVSGAGWMGSGFVAQVARMPGMMVNILADSNVTLARCAFEATGVPSGNIVEANRPGVAMDLLNSGKRVVTGDYELASLLDGVDVVVDVTASAAIGAVTAYAAIQGEKPIVLVNVEADVTVGRILHHLAQSAGVLYSVSSGDEPGCLAELWDYVMTLGLEPIAIGKGKNNPLDRAATPATVAELARKSKKEPYQVASYVDGTKTMFEMACAANATGCVPLRRGMVGPEATLDTVSEIFALKDDGGIVPSPGIVDFVLGSSMSGGVFITARVNEPRIAEDLQYLRVAKGNYCTFFRPYHLWFIEAPLSVGRAYLRQEPWLVPSDRAVADVMAVAKTDLTPGVDLDGFGGYAYYGTLDRVEETRRLHALPLGLAPGARVIQVVRAGEIIRWNDVELDESSTVVKLRRQQEAIL